ncbi:MAG: cbb3-type cytochrome c oxidase N-terminal domain-containing protein [Algisphaera sp.]
MPEPQDQLTGHNYDGIQEYDNPTPGWWLWIFGITVVFGFAYAFVMITMPNLFGVHAAYDKAVIAREAAQFAELGEIKGDAATLLSFLEDDSKKKFLGIGQGIYTAQCAACHGGAAQGSVGPNLTDEAYVYVDKIEDIYDVLVKGRKNGAMPAWRNRLPENDIILVSAYVASLRGTNVPGKAAEGDVPAPWGE